MPQVKNILRKRRQKRIRKKVIGTAERPRFAVFRSSNHIYAQIINDDAGHTIISASTLDKDMASFGGHKGNKKAAERVGKLLEIGRASCRERV